MLFYPLVVVFLTPTPTLSSLTVSARSEPHKKGPDVEITRLPRPPTTYQTNYYKYDADMYMKNGRPTSPEVYTYPASLQSSSPSLSPSYIYAKSQKSASSVISNKGIHHNCKQGPVIKPLLLYCIMFLGANAKSDQSFFFCYIYILKCSTHALS